MKRLLSVFVFFLIITSFPGLAAGSENVHKINDELTAIVSFEKGEYLLGEPVTLKIRALNCGSNSLDIQEIITEYFKFSVKDENGNSVKQHKPPAQISIFTSIYPVPSGSDYNDVVFVNKRVNFQKPGTYIVSYKGCLLVWKNSRQNPKDRNILSFSGSLKLKIKKGSRSQLEKALRKYLEMLQSENSNKSRRASQALTVSDEKLGVKLLNESLQEKNQSLQYYSSKSTWALAKIGTTDSIQTLMALAEHSQFDTVRAAAIDELGRWHIKAAVPVLVRLLNSADPVLRRRALEALGDIRDRSCIPNVEPLLNDLVVSVRTTAEKVHKLLSY